MVEKDEYYIAMNQLEPDLPLSDINILFNIMDLNLHRYQYS